MGPNSTLLRAFIFQDAANNIAPIRGQLEIKMTDLKPEVLVPQIADGINVNFQRHPRILFWLNNIVGRILVYCSTSG